MEKTLGRSSPAFRWNVSRISDTRTQLGVRYQIQCDSLANWQSALEKLRQDAPQAGWHAFPWRSFADRKAELVERKRKQLGTANISDTQAEEDAWTEVKRDRNNPAGQGSNRLGSTVTFAQQNIRGQKAFQSADFRNYMLSKDIQVLAVQEIYF